MNDLDGHLEGDRALQAVAEELRNNSRPSDLIGRPGGDEFVVVQPVDSVEAAVEHAQRLLVAVSQRLTADFPDAGLGATGGLTVGDQTMSDFTALLRESDNALITAKDESKGMLQLAQRLVGNPV